MKKHFLKKSIALGFIAALILSILVFIPRANYQKVPSSAQLVIPPHKTEPSDDIFHSGKNGINELHVLKTIVPLEQDHSGLVVSINGRKADNKKHEFWAFYVNGKFASVGPADYVTKDGDKIEWKIEKYY